MPPIFPPTLRPNLESARLDNLALMRALDATVADDSPHDHPTMVAWFELEADACAALWALDQPHHKIDTAVVLLEATRALANLPAARAAAVALFTPEQQEKITGLATAIRADLVTAQAYSGVPGRDPNAPPVPGTEPARAAVRIGRNDPCFCGSGKKYKKCHIDAPAPTTFE